ncbi:MAG TPA: hypothetical protein VIR15_07160 [Intrasporangium sp.]|jgi:hypothetical protein|uniref:hypothetical protein n=1 Tax=Intrasporangium sp. TaxID=1925024 RepID=UPI002F94BE7B
MTADTLRRAAEVLRALSNGSTEGPWLVGHEVDGAYAERRTVVRAQGLRVVTVGQTRQHHHREAEANVAFIATMHPGVGLALADWLQLEADRLGWLENYATPQALTVARAILGEAS